MLCRSLDEKIESLTVLEAALSNGAPLLSPMEEKENVKNNLVQVFVNNYDQASNTCINANATGILLTKDGFILTAYHLVKDALPVWEAQMQTLQGMELGYEKTADLMAKEGFAVTRKEIYPVYPLDISFKEANPDLDLVLLKAIIPEHPEPTGIHFCSGELTDMPVTGLGRPEPNGFNSLYERNGVVEAVLLNKIVTNVKAEKGMSGGVFMNELGEIAGQISRRAHFSDGKIVFSHGTNSQYMQNYMGAVATIMKKSAGR